MQQLDPLRNSTSNTYLLLKNILITPRYKKQYIAHMRTMITENITNGWYSTRASELQAICGPHVQADPNFFYTYANFLANLNSAVTGGSGGPGGGQTIPGITQLMGTRGTYLLNSTAFAGTVPTLVNHGFSPAEVEPGGTVQFTATATDAIYMQLGFRQNHAHKFNYHQMYDDGAHGDGAAGDGVWGVSIPVAYGNIEYFYWAENASQGMFFPPRAEFEFFSIPVASTTGEILINEVMAKNASYADPNGQFDDWVELYNPNDYPVDIGGMYMTDNHYSSGISAWTQIPATSPALTTIPPHGYLIVWFDEDLDQGPLHINDKLSGSADAVYLIAADGQTVVDSYIWTEAQDLNVDDRSIGRLPDGGQTWVLFGAGQANPSTPGAANPGTVNEPPGISGISYSPLDTTAQTPVTVSATVTDPNGDLTSVTLLYGSDENALENLNMVGVGTVFSATIGPFDLGTVIKYRVQATDANAAITQTPLYTIIIGYSAPTLYINELMPSNTSTITDENAEYEDWVEIFNPNGFEVDLAGYYLTDNHYPEIGASLTRIPSGVPETVIPAHGYKLIWFDEHLSQGPLHINTKLSTTADAVYLIAPDMLTVIDQIVWTADTALNANLSYARYPNGSDTWIVCGDGYPHAVTPGNSNSPTSNEDDLIGSVKPVLKVYPNPAQKDLTIELAGSKAPYQVQIYNLKGQLVYDAKVVDSSKTTWNGMDKSGRRAGNGIYFVSVATASGRQIKKICLAQ